MTRKKKYASLDEVLEASRKLTHEEHMERVKKAVEGSLRRSGVLKTKKKRRNL
jgi:hypothetical protein